jgi:hypothetical protein
MLVYVMPGATPPTPLALINELNALRFRNPVTAVRLRQGDESENSRVAREWAETRGIPVTNGGLPGVVVFTADMTDPERFPDLDKERRNAWSMARREDPDQRPLTGIRYLLSRKRTVWVNTGHADYANMAERKKILEQAG